MSRAFGNATECCGRCERCISCSFGSTTGKKRRSTKADLEQACRIDFDKNGVLLHVTLLHGFALTLLGGVSVGFSAWSLKWARIWKFENYWLLNCILSLIILPFSLAYWLLPHLGNVYASLGAREALKPFLFGAFWGIALLGAGVCMHKLGFAVSGAV